MQHCFMSCLNFVVFYSEILQVVIYYPIKPHTPPERPSSATETELPICLKADTCCMSRAIYIYNLNIYIYLF